MNKIIKFLKKVWKWILSLFTRKKKRNPKMTSLFEDMSHHTEVSSKLESPNNPISKPFKVIREDYASITTLLKVLNSRENNVPMKREHASTEALAEFTGTTSYSEAEELILKGYSKILPQISSKYKKNIKILSQNYVRMQNPIVNEMYGGVPNVPRSIMCLPKDLITREIIKRKTKTISVIYSISAPWQYTPSKLY